MISLLMSPDQTQNGLVLFLFNQTEIEVFHYQTQNLDSQPNAILENL